jgi:tetratricopeptide (TPR) repeat protein
MNRTDLQARWQTLQLLRPVFELLNRAAPRADFDHRGYDLAQLALRLIDYVVLNQASLDASVSPAAVVDHLTQVARRMHPTDQQRPWAKVARLVFGVILNDGRPHEALWVEPAREEDGETGPPQPFRYRLLRLTDGPDGAAVTATDEAIVLYLQALNTDLADRALALKLMVEIQMQAGEFDKALASARQATRTAQGLAAGLREKLEDTRRDIRSVDWHGEMPTWLSDVLDQLAQQLDRDRQLRDLATTASADPSAHDACLHIVDEVRRGEDVWLRLESYVERAIPVFLAAQETQRFQPRGLAAAIDLTRDLLAPALTVPDEVFAEAVDGLAAGIFPPVTPPHWGLDELCAQLLRAPAIREQAEPEIDHAEDLGDPLDDSIPDDVAACASDILAVATDRPARLSELLSAARARKSEVDDPRRLLDVVWGAALYVFVADAEAGADDRPRRADLAAAVAALVAVDDGVSLRDGRFVGPDLMLATPAALDLLDLEVPA